MVKPISGRILFLGEDISKLTPQARVELGIVQVPEGRLVFPEMSIRENLLLGGINAHARKHRPQQMEKVIGLFPRLGERLTQSAGSLSGGEQQMLAIGRGLMAEAKLLMLDEPSLGLSPLFVQYIFEIIDKLHADGPDHPAGGAESESDVAPRQALLRAGARAGGGRGRCGDREERSAHPQRLSWSVL